MYPINNMYISQTHITHAHIHVHSEMKIPLRESLVLTYLFNRLLMRYLASVDLPVPQQPHINTHAPT